LKKTPSRSLAYLVCKCGWGLALCRTACDDKGRLSHVAGKLIVMDASRSFREQLASLLDWEQAHVGFERAVDGLSTEMQGKKPQQLPFSCWQILEHMRLAQKDILDYCREKDYAKKKWPDDYWPTEPAPPDAQAWVASVAAFQADRAELKKLAADSTVDLLQSVPSSKKHTLLREILVVADHTAYHLGQLIYVRRLLGAWKD